MDKRRKFLRRLDKKPVSVSSTDGNNITRGNLRYDHGRVLVNELQIPICAMRNVASWNYGGYVALIFVEPAYKIGERR